MKMSEKQNEYFYSMFTEEESRILEYIPTVSGLLDFALQNFAERPAVSDGNISYSYRELYERVAVRRGYLNELGLKRGDRIAVFSPNTVDAMELYLAIVTSGYVSLMLPAALDGNTLDALCKKFKISCLFYDESLKAVADKAAIRKYNTVYCAAKPIDAAEVTKDTVCSICLTGGTTGVPKGAVMTHGAIMRGAFNGCFAPGETLYQRYIAILPLSHIFGLVRGFLSCLYTGGLVFECRDVKSAFAQIPVLKPTILVIVPGMAEIIIGLTKLKGKGFSSSLKMLIIGAAPVPPRLMKEIDALGIGVVAGYGLTEGANLTSGNKAVLEKPESMGMIYPEQQAKVVDGELRIKGDNLMLGYWEDEEETAAAFDEDGWLKTGDLVRFDEDGCIYITGRIKNLIVLGNGENVSPEELEKYFYKYDTVKDCLVKEDSINGKPVIAVEILPLKAALGDKSDEETEKLFKEITDEINSLLPTYKQISKTIIRKEDFKRTNSMKVSRNQGV